MSIALSHFAFAKWFLNKHRQSGIFVDGYDFDFIISQLDIDTWNEFSLLQSTDVAKSTADVLIPLLVQKIPDIKPKQHKQTKTSRKPKSVITDNFRVDAATSTDLLPVTDISLIGQLRTEGIEGFSAQAETTKEFRRENDEAPKKAKKPPKKKQNNIVPIETTVPDISVIETSITVIEQLRTEGIERFSAQAVETTKEFRRENDEAPKKTKKPPKKKQNNIVPIETVIEANVPEAIVPVIDANVSEAIVPVIDAIVSEAIVSETNVPVIDAIVPVIEANVSEAIVIEVIVPVIETTVSEVIVPVIEANVSEAIVPVIETTVSEAIVPVIETSVVQEVSKKAPKKATKAAPKKKQNIIPPMIINGGETTDNIDLVEKKEEKDAPVAETFVTETFVEEPKKRGPKPKISKESKDSKESKQPKQPKELKEPKEPKKQPKESKEPKEPKKRGPKKQVITELPPDKHTEDTGIFTNHNLSDFTNTTQQTQVRKYNKIHEHPVEVVIPVIEPELSNDSYNSLNHDDHDDDVELTELFINGALHYIDANQHLFDSHFNPLSHSVLNP